LISYEASLVFFVVSWALTKVFGGVGGPLGSPKGIHGGACDVWNYENQREICVKADKCKFAKELSLLEIDIKRWKYV